jgi:dTDP-4-dehydrorhamnose reductase
MSSHEAFRSMRLLVTGANGQIGWELRRSLMALGEVIALDRTACDLACPDTLSAVVRAAAPHAIVNAAAYTSVDRAESDEPVATLVNGTAAGVLAQAARDVGALFVHYSTDYVFDGAKADAYSEDDQPRPLNAYGRSKLVGETAVRESGADHLILRTSWVYAARGDNFLRTILRLAREHDELTIVDDQIGAPTWAHDIADATAEIIRAAQAERVRDTFTAGTFHLVAAGATSWHGFAQAILAHISDVRSMAKPRLRAIASEDYPARALRPKNSLLSGERLRQRFGVALLDWRVGMARCLDEICELEK